MKLRVVREEKLALKTESTESLRLSIKTLNRASSCSSSCKSAVDASRVQIRSACDCSKKKKFIFPFGKKVRKEKK